MSTEEKKNRFLKPHSISPTKFEPILSSHLQYSKSLIGFDGQVKTKATMGRAKIPYELKSFASRH